MSRKSSPPESDDRANTRSPGPSVIQTVLRVLQWIVGLALAGAVSLAMIIAIALAVAFPNLPDVSALSDYRPILPLRVYTADGLLIGEFGEERRNLTRLKDMPKVVTDAVLAIEDHRFYEHGGVDYKGMMRAAFANLSNLKSQGASTITMQVARNVYLSSEKTYTRKIYEVLLTFKLEHLLTKEQILEIYMNQIFLGNRAYGFAAASEAYFDKPLRDITVAEAAMLAGLPKAPGTNNPIRNPKRARARQLLVIDRMEETGFITAQQAQVARAEKLKLKGSTDAMRVHAEFVAETVRQLVFAQYGNETYTRGLNVYTTIRSVDQDAAYKALRRGIMDFERRQVYRGPEKFINLPAGDPQAMDEAIGEALDAHPDNGDVMSAVILDVNSRRIQAVRQNGETLEITGEGLEPARSGLSDKAPPNIRLRQGAVIRVARTPRDRWEITQLPEVEGAFVSMDPRNGAIKAMVGGFDFEKNKFNHVTQAWRQPGSSFKPFIYSAALEKGFTPATIINDAPLFFDASFTGGQPWEPKNYDGKFDGPMTLRTALAKSKNMVSIRIMQAVGPPFAREWATHFGFDAERHLPYLTMALGAGTVTPMQMAGAYAVFANGGYRVNPWLISKVTEQSGRVLMENKPRELDESVRAISARNAFVMNSLLNEVTRAGTAARAQVTLKRNDLYGKTGTTNDSMDAWFAGYQPTQVAVTWMGYDTPRQLGARATGGGLSLPIWISYMDHALKDAPVAPYAAPDGLVNTGGEWYFSEFAYGRGVTSLGMEELPPPADNGSVEIAPLAEERNRILDLFRQNRNN